MAPNKFAESERVLCFHGPLIYEAKVMKFRTSPKSADNEYWVHYAGWSKKWDEWVPETRVLKYNESNLAHQRELAKSQGSDKKLKNKGSKGGRISIAKDAGESANDSVDPDSRSSTPNLDPRGRLKADRKIGSPTPAQDVIDKKTKKVKSDHPVETEEQFLNKVEIKIKIPDELKPWLVDDNIMITKKKKLVILPAKISADQVLIKWVHSKKTVQTAQVSKEIAKGIQEYFNVMLNAKLLYKEEREQYNEKITSCNPSPTPSSVYGAIHLLRLFTKVGHTLTYSLLSEKTMSLTLSSFQDCLRFMAANVALYYSYDNYA